MEPSSDDDDDDLGVDTARSSLTSPASKVARTPSSSDGGAKKRTTPSEKVIESRKTLRELIELAKDFKQLIDEVRRNLKKDVAICESVPRERPLSEDPVILLVGESGSGKSTFLELFMNFYARNDHEYTSYTHTRVDACEYGDPTPSGHIRTQRPIAYDFRSKDGKERFTIIDTPGLRDDGGFQADERHLTAIVGKLEEFEYNRPVTAMFIFYNGSQVQLKYLEDYVYESFKVLLPRESRTVASHTYFVATHSISTPQNTVCGLVPIVFDNPLAIYRQYELFCRANGPGSRVVGFRRPKKDVDATKKNFLSRIEVSKGTDFSLLYNIIRGPVSKLTGIHDMCDNFQAYTVIRQTLDDIMNQYDSALSTLRSSDQANSPYEITSFVQERESYLSNLPPKMKNLGYSGVLRNASLADEQDGYFLLFGREFFELCFWGFWVYISKMLSFMTLKSLVEIICVFFYVSRFIFVCCKCESSPRKIWRSGVLWYILSRLIHYIIWYNPRPHVLSLICDRCFDIVVDFNCHEVASNIGDVYMQEIIGPFIFRADFPLRLLQCISYDYHKRDKNLRECRLAHKLDASWLVFEDLGSSDESKLGSLHERFTEEKRLDKSIAEAKRIMVEARRPGGPIAKAKDLVDSFQKRSLINNFSKFLRKKMEYFGKIKAESEGIPYMISHVTAMSDEVERLKGIIKLLEE